MGGGVVGRQQGVWPYDKVLKESNLKKAEGKAVGFLGGRRLTTWSPKRAPMKKSPHNNVFSMYLRMLLRQVESLSSP